MFGANHTKAIIEISKGSRSKYEIDKESGLLTLERELLLPYPANYGFIPDTLSDDGDALDIFVISHYPIDPLTVIRYAPVGYLDMYDQGVRDEKIIATLPGFDGKVKMDEITYFLQNYKPGVEIKTIGLNHVSAVEAIGRARLKYLEALNENTE